MGIAAACLRGIYHHFSPYFHRMSRVEPGREVKRRESSRSNLQHQKSQIPQLPSTVIAFTEDSIDDLTPEHYWPLLIEKYRKQSIDVINRDYRYTTVYCYIVATLKDFDKERAIISKEIIPEVEKWCSNLQIQFIYINLQQNEVPSTELLSLTLHELDRITDSTCMSFVIVLLSETLGWIPTEKEKREAGVKGWPRDVSFFEMEILKGTFAITNSNAIFMFRNPSFLRGLSEESLSLFQEPESWHRLDYIRKKINETFPQQVFHYQCTVISESSSRTSSTSGVNIEVELYFKKTIYEFIVNRLLREYSMKKFSSLSVVQSNYQQNELETYSQIDKSNKEQILSKIRFYINSIDYSPPLVLVGEEGSGKSTILTALAKEYMLRQSTTDLTEIEGAHQTLNEYVDFADNLVRKDAKPDHFRDGKKCNRSFLKFKKSKKVVPLPQNQLQATEFGDLYQYRWNENESKMMHHLDNSEQPWHVFYHFVGMYPRSSDLHHILQRVWSIPTLSYPKISLKECDVNSLAKKVLLLLSSRSEKRTLIIIDSIDKIKDEHPSHVLKWLPTNLPPTVKVIVSLGPTSVTRKVFSSREPQCQEVFVGSLPLMLSKKIIVSSLLKDDLPHNERLIDILLGKLSICNPLYIKEVVEFLSRHTSELTTEDDIIQIARSLPNNLTNLHYRSIIELESSSHGRYLIACLCLLHCSHYGLQESELRTLLSAITSFGYNEPNPPPQTHDQSCDQQDVSQRQTDPKTCQGEFLTVTPNHRGQKNHSLTIPHCSNPMRQTLHCPNSFSDNDDTSTYNVKLTLNTKRKMSDCTDSSQKDSLVSPLQSSHVQNSPKAQSLTVGKPYSPSNMLSPHFSSLNQTLNCPELTTTLPLRSPSITSEGSPLSSRPLHLLPIPSRVGSSASILSVDYAQSSCKSHSKSIEQHNSDNDEIEVAVSDDFKPHPFPTPLVGLERVNILEHHLESSGTWVPISSHIMASIFKSLEPFLKSVGRHGESRWSLKDSSFSKAVHKRYFKTPPTESFPFSFCTSSTFYGADKDQTLFTLLTEAHRRGSNFDDKEEEESQRPSVSTSILSGCGLDSAAKTVDIDISKRYSWWHARLAGYFSTSTNEERRYEELPYHLSRINDYGRLAHCLVHMPLFERLSTEENVMELIQYWHYTGGYSNIVDLYQHSLDAAEITGTKPQDMINLMKKVAWFLHQMGQNRAARQILVDAIQYEEDKLNGRLESLAHLTLALSEVLSHSIQQQTMNNKSTLKAEYRLINVASQCVQFLRSKFNAKRDLSKILLLLSHHLYHYSQENSSLDLSPTNALVQAQEAAQEALVLYSELGDVYQVLQAFLQLSTVYQCQPIRSIEFLLEAKELCSEHYGSMNTIMLTLLQRLAYVYKELMYDNDTGLYYYRQWMDLTSFMYGNHHSLTIEAKEFVQNETERVQENKNREITREVALFLTSETRDEDNKLERELTIVAEIMS